MSWQRWKGIMKCYPFEESRLAKWCPPYIVQPKFDGDRCRVEPTESSCLLLSSEENPFFSVPHIHNQLMNSGLRYLPLDGELYNHEIFKEGGHEAIHSIVSRTVNLHPNHRDMEFWIFDLKVKGMPQVARLKELLRLDLSATPNIRLAPYWICNDLSEIKEIYDTLIFEGYEGIIIRHIDNAYVERRSPFLMKFKPKRQDTYIIVGYNEEVSMSGAPKNRLGSLILSSQTGDTFAVSAGLNDVDRDRLWRDRDLLVGKAAVVHYQHLTNKQIPKGCFDIEILEEKP